MWSLKRAAALAALLVAALRTSPSAADEKRPLPDYDGRGKPKTTVGDVAIWVPRVAVSPLYFTSEYVVRRPLGWLVQTAEKNHWPTKILDFFTFDKDRKSGVVPTALFDFGFRPSVGLYFFFDDAFARGNAIRVHAATWGPSWLSFSVADRVTLIPDRATFTWRAEWTRRSDGLYHGIGPRTHEREAARYGFTRFETGPSFELRFLRASGLRATMGLRTGDFREDKQCCGDPTLAEQLANDAVTMPPGFEAGYTAVFQRLELAFDSRTKNTTGARFAVEAEHDSDIRNAQGRQWLRYGAHLGGFVDLDGKARVLGLVVSALFADPLSKGDIPFNEQVVLGGWGPMRGYKPGRLHDRSALVATLQYQWPIWVFLDGTAHVAAGNVFGERLRAFDPRLLRFSAAVGFRTVGSPDHQFEILVGGGTETIESGAQITSFRLVFGGTRGF